MSAAHTGRPWLSVSTHRTSVAVCGCPCVSVSTHMTSVPVCGCPLTHTGRPCVSVSTQRTSVCVRQHTQDVCVCPSAHTGRPWLSVCVCQHTQDVHGCSCVSVCVCQHTQDVRGCPSVYISARWSLDSARWPFSWMFGGFWPTWAVCSVHRGRPWVSACTHRTSVCLRQHTQDVRDYLSVHISACWSLDSER